MTEPIDIDTTTEVAARFMLCLAVKQLQDCGFRVTAQLLPYEIMSGWHVRYEVSGLCCGSDGASNPLRAVILWAQTMNYEAKTMWTRPEVMRALTSPEAST